MALVDSLAGPVSVPAPGPTAREAAAAPSADELSEVPTGAPGVNRPAALRPLVSAAAADFEGVERPSGSLDGRYARVRATLDASQFPGELYDIASRIVDDGVDHYSAFRRMVMIVGVYDQPEPPHLRPGFTLASPDEPAVADALMAQGRVMSLLSQGDAGNAAKIAEARRVMLADFEQAIETAARSGFGVPLF